MQGDANCFHNEKFHLSCEDEAKELESDTETVTNDSDAGYSGGNEIENGFIRNSESTNPQMTFIRSFSHDYSPGAENKSFLVSPRITLSKYSKHLFIFSEAGKPIFSR